MWERTAERLSKVFLGVFLVCFGTVFCHLLLMQPLAAVACGGFALLWLMIAGVVAIQLYHKQGLLERYRYRILTVVLLMLFGIQIAFGVALETDPMFDFEALFRGAQSWAQTGGLGNYQDYYDLFPNNLGGAFLLKCLFQITNGLGLHQDYLVGTLFNVVLIDLTYLLVFLICERLLDTLTAMLALFFCVGFLPMYFFAPIFYSDTLSMFFVALVFYLYVRVQRIARRGLRLILYGLTGIALAVGASIKFSVVIVAVAIFFDLLLFHRIRRVLLPAGMTVAVFLLCTMLLQSCFYSSGLDREVAKQKNVPYEHWVMMGLKGNGTYNPEDYEFTYSFADPMEKRQAIREEIVRRVKAYGFGGMLQHLGEKSAYLFGDGTYRVSEFLDDNPKYHTVLHELGLYSGRYYKIFFGVAQAMHLASWALILFAAFCAIRQNGKGRTLFVPLLSLFGLLLFLMLWEVNPRYLLNFFPMNLICAAAGLRAAVFILQNRKRGRRFRRKEKSLA